MWFDRITKSVIIADYSTSVSNITIQTEFLLVAALQLTAFPTLLNKYSRVIATLISSSYFFPYSRIVVATVLFAIFISQETRSRVIC